MASDPILILGSGMAALGAASRIAAEGRPAVLFDGNAYPGGHTATFDAGAGFLFDDGPHVSFTKDERIRELFAANVDGAFEDVPAHINNYWHGSWIPHPVQMHLYGLPTDLIVAIIRDYVAVHVTERAGGARLRDVAAMRPTATPSPKPSRWSMAGSTTRRRWTG